MWLILLIVATASAKSSPKCTEPSCGLNEKYVKCKTICPPQNCSIANTDYTCDDVPTPCIPGCDCIKDYLRDDNGICIYKDDCFAPVTENPPPCPEPQNSEPKKRSSSSSSSSHSSSSSSSHSSSKSSSHSSSSCSSSSTSKCETKKKPCSDTPKCGLNEKYVKCKTVCPPQSCNISYTTYLCDKDIKCTPGCDCIDNYLRNLSGICILNDDCPPPNPCSANETYASCSFDCPSDFCPKDDDLGTVACDAPIDCPPGCNCKPNYKRISEEDRTCILASECDTPKCGLNEKYVKCKTVCPPQSCNISYTTYICNKDIICTPGCDCIDNYLRNSSGICILNDDCPPPNPCSANETYASCSFDCPSDFCPKDDDLGTVACDAPIDCPPGCNCKPNYRRISEEDRTCILASECESVTCTRQNEEWCSCPSPYLAESCADVNNEPITDNSYDNCVPRCICKKGYFRDANDLCVPADQCPQKCCANETYADCGWLGCPHYFCPEDDSLEILACKPPRDCPPGCMCKFDYKRKSHDDPTCILGQECPPVDCTRPNEVWNPCPSACLAESCADVDNQPTTCNTFAPVACEPRCTCRKGHFRNKDNICIPASKCPKPKRGGGYGTK